MTCCGRATVLHEEVRANRGVLPSLTAQHLRARTESPTAIGQPCLLLLIACLRYVNTGVEDLSVSATERSNSCNSSPTRASPLASPAAGTQLQFPPSVSPRVRFGVTSPEEAAAAAIAAVDRGERDRSSACSAADVATARSVMKMKSIGTRSMGGRALTVSASWRSSGALNLSSAAAGAKGGSCKGTAGGLWQDLCLRRGDVIATLLWGKGSLKTFGTWVVSPMPQPAVCTGGGRTFDMDSPLSASLLLLSCASCPYCTTWAATCSNPSSPTVASAGAMPAEGGLQSQTHEALQQLLGMNASVDSASIKR